MESIRSYHRPCSCISTCICSEIVAQYAGWSYAILFAVIFCETGLVVTPFLPGDSLLFAAGAVAATGALNPWWLFLALSMAAILGDTVNYWLGHYVGPKAFTGKVRFLEEGTSRPHASLLREIRRQNDHSRAIRAHRPHVRPVRGRNRRHELREIHPLQHRRRNRLGRPLRLCADICSRKSNSCKRISPSVIIAIIVISVMPMAFEYWRARREAKREGGRRKAEE